MSLEHLDVQWTVVCDGSAQAALAAMKSRAESRGWTLKLEVQNLSGDDVRMGGAWPSETLGSGYYVKGERYGRHKLFWSTYSDEARTKITGGLYLHEFAEGHADALAGCERAIGDLRHLFDAPEVSCLVLVLEDDDGIDVAPGIVGIYRTAVWRGIRGAGRGGVIEQPDGEWVLVRPAEQEDTLASVHSMPEPIQESLEAIQAALDRMFWPARD